jgi:acetyl esterase/lipase
VTSGVGTNPDGVIIERDVVYNRDPRRPLTLHLLRPAGPAAGARPAIAYFFGGAFRQGSKDRGIDVLLPFARRGYVCASAEYRLSGEAVFPATVQDCKCAIRFLRANSAALGIDPGRIGACGHSSGGYMATMLGVTGGVAALEGDDGWADASSAVQAVCDWYGPTDFLRMNAAGSTMDHDAADSPESQFIGGPIQEHPERVARANPIAYITPDRPIPPFLIVHGDADPLVPFNQSELLAAALEAVGADYRFHRVAGGGHGGPALESEVIRALVDRFFDERLAPHRARRPRAGS